MGDGSLVLIPPRVTPPARSRCSSGGGRLPRLLLVGDLTYEAELLKRRQLPGVGDRPAQCDDRQGAGPHQRMPGLIILPAHDPTAAQRLLESTR